MLRRCACGGGGECEECRKKRASLRRSASGQFAPGFAPPLVHDVLRSPGQPLDEGTRAFMEPRFGHSFADVRIHAGARAAESASAVRANAYAVGRDVVFGAGKYGPGTVEGRQLIAHELAHVVQQSAGGAAPMASLEVGATDAPEERQAEAVARRVMDGGRAMLGGGAPVRVARLVVGGSTEDMHHDIAERWRREQGLPPGGVYEHGERAGPTDAELVYTRGAMDTREPCPAPNSGVELLCLNAVKVPQATCHLTAEHHRVLAKAQGKARVQLEGAARRLNTVDERGRQLIMRQARRSFQDMPPTWEDVRTKVLAMESIVSGKIQYAGAACGDATCYSPGSAGYVDEVGKMPIYICVRSFMPELESRLSKTIIHEVAHLAGVTTKKAYQEIYCEASACDTPCHGVNHADSWVHFINCIGGPAVAPRTGFKREMTRDVENRGDPR